MNAFTDIVMNVEEYFQRQTFFYSYFKRILAERKRETREKTKGKKKLPHIVFKFDKRALCLQDKQDKLKMGNSVPCMSVSTLSNVQMIKNSKPSAFPQQRQMKKGGKGETGWSPPEETDEADEERGKKTRKELNVISIEMDKNDESWFHWHRNNEEQKGSFEWTIKPLFRGNNTGLRVISMKTEGGPSSYNQLFAGSVLMQIDDRNVLLELFEVIKLRLESFQFQKLTFQKGNAFEEWFRTWSLDDVLEYADRKMYELRENLPMEYLNYYYSHGNAIESNGKFHPPQSSLQKRALLSHVYMFNDVQYMFLLTVRRYLLDELGIK
ncbi:hypothetical protein RFI_00634 [Reticulomyxa filosa]|uniref:Uncharacterized protein n=1 Tax=Reticulomyxa filosa TaxID=46433 RepID=X6PE99_RETFI|nr:hypothetical protein RFI_00634 [Reticulomyxa filosa]|eukprot:ETO36413.1 hypothetical protein RFI_00634 [Reticulomyxa filosa]